VHGVEEFVHTGREKLDSIAKSISEQRFAKELTKKKDAIEIRYQKKKKKNIKKG